tara:strand:+ start:265 stop:447 length:183 start_codon:yes stop_codon:yes gene_type:complete
MGFLKNISPTAYLVISLLLLTFAIGILFLGKYIFAILSAMMGLIFLIAWTFFGLFEESST